MRTLNKEMFVKKLKDKLDILEDSVQEEEINEYVKKIEEQEKSDLKEEDIIKSFGSINEISRKILKKHGINPNKVLKKDRFLYKKFEELFEVIHKVVDVMSKNSLEENAKIILDILILIAFVCLLKIPFVAIRDLGDSLLSYTSIPVLYNLWGILIDIIYIIVAVFVFMNIFTKWFKNLKSTKKLKVKSLDTVTLGDKKE